MKTKPQACTDCPAFEVGRSFVPGVGPRDATIALVGQGPGEDEAWGGVPFVGRSGRMLDRWLTRAGLYRHKVWIGNIVQCWLPGNRAPRVDEVDHCWSEHWGGVLAQMPNLRVIVAIGVPAMQRLMGPGANSEWAGLVLQGRGRHQYLTGLLHPAHIMRGAWDQEPVQVRYLQRARQIAETGEWPILDPQVPPPGAILHPTLDQMTDWIQGIGPRGVTVDIETAGRHIVCVGMCRIDDLVPIVFHFLKQGGERYWADEEDWVWVRFFVARVLDNPKIAKTFHNGQAFDVRLLKLNGFEVKGFQWDTLLMGHIAYAEMEKGLEYLSKVYLGTGGWKHMLDIDGDGEWK